MQKFVPSDTEKDQIADRDCKIFQVGQGFIKVGHGFLDRVFLDRGFLSPWTLDPVLVMDFADLFDARVEFYFQHFVRCKVDKYTRNWRGKGEK